MYSEMLPVACTNHTHHDFIDMLNHGMVENTKNWNILITEHNFSTK